MALTDIAQEYDRSKELDRVVVSAVVPAPLTLGDLDVYLEKLERPSRHPLSQPILVINNASTGMELAKVELEGALGRHWDKVEAKFNRKSRVLTVAVALLPEAPAANETANGGGVGAGDRDEEGSEQSFRSAESEGEFESGGGGGGGSGEGTGSDSSPLDSPGRPVLSPDGVCHSVAVAAAGKPPSLSPQQEQLQAQLTSEAGAPGEGGAAAKKRSKKRSKKSSKKKGKGEVGEGGESGGERAAQEVEAGEVGQAAEPDAALAPAPETQQQAGEQGPEEDPQQLESETEREVEEERGAQLAALAPALPLGRGVWASEPKSEWSALSGPLIRDALAKQKSVGKGEDQWLQKARNGWSIEGVPGEATFSVFGIFDGHGGRSVATYASNNLLKNIMARVNAGDGEGEGATLVEVPELEGLPEEERQRWRLQATLMRRLPRACHDGFMSCDREARRSFSKGGSTATLAFGCGWELLVANCGDSCAYLDTGSEVLLVSGNHRLETNAAEQERIRREGGEIERSTVDGKPVGPLRVWPGGLAMSRSIGDAEAGERVTGEPELCQVTIPPGGARLIMGSDGLWDAVHPKSAANATRDMSAVEAAHRLLHQAIKADNLKDDVSIIVVDFLPDPSHKLPPSLPLHRSSSSGSHLSRASSAGAGAALGLSLSRATSTASRRPSEAGMRLANVWHPLGAGAVGAGAAAGSGGSSPRQATLSDYVRRGAERREDVLAELHAAAEERLAEEQVVKERQQEAFCQMLKKAQQEGASASLLREALAQSAGAAQGAVGSLLQGGSGGDGGSPQGGSRAVSSLYEELANLRLTQEDVAACFAWNEAETEREERERREQAEAAEEEWETVGTDKRAQRQQQQLVPQRGRGRGAGQRGGRAGGRIGGRVSGRRPERREGWQETPHQGQQGKLDPAHCLPSPHLQQWAPAEQQQQQQAAPLGQEGPAAGEEAALGFGAGAAGEALPQRAPRSGRGRGEHYPHGAGGGSTHRPPYNSGAMGAGEGPQQAQQQQPQQQEAGQQQRYRADRPFLGHRQGPRAGGAQAGGPPEAGPYPHYAHHEQRHERYYERRPRGEGTHLQHDQRQQGQQQGGPSSFGAPLGEREGQQHGPAPAGGGGRRRDDRTGGPRPAGASAVHPKQALDDGAGAGDSSASHNTEFLERRERGPASARGGYGNYGGRGAQRGRGRGGRSVPGGHEAGAPNAGGQQQFAPIDGHLEQQQRYQQQPGLLREGGGRGYGGWGGGGRGYYGGPGGRVGRGRGPPVAPAAPAQQ